MNEERTQERRPHDRHAHDAGAQEVPGPGEERADGESSTQAAQDAPAGGSSVQAEPGGDAVPSAPAANGGEDEAEILRSELATLQERLAQAEREAAEAKDRALRARAELDTVRRRAGAEESRAHESGVDTAVTPAIAAFDDLRRALAAAETGDAEEIVPGVRAVMEGLERNLEQLDIRRIGEVGETFDPSLHEALTSAPTEDPERAGTIAEVFEVGFVRGGRLIRPARVVVYQGQEG